MKRRMVAWLLVLGLAGWAAGCDDDNADGGRPSQEEEAEEEAGGDLATNAVVSVAGTWLFKHEVMVLEQNYMAVTGRVEVSGFEQDPGNPVEYPVPVVGSVETNGAVALSELLIYPQNPDQSYTIDKVGALSGDALVLQVIRGQDPQTQTWTRQAAAGAE